MHWISVNVVLVTFSLIAALPASGDEAAVRDEATTVQTTDRDTPTVYALQTARIQAASLHAAMHSALRVTHDRFYREDEGLPIPAAAMKEVFEDIQKNRGITLRWLVVEGQAMNTDHTAKTEFEVAAVRAIKSGKPVFEQVKAGVYRRVGPITLSNHCLKCHVPDRKSLRDRKAGLMISMSISDDGT